MKNICMFLVFLFCASVPVDFLTGRSFSGISASTILSVPIILIFIFNTIIKKEIYLPNTLAILILIPLIGLPQLIINGNYPLDRIATYFYYVVITIAIINLSVHYKIKVNLIIIASTVGVLLMSINLLTEGTIGYGGTRLATATRDLNPNNASGFILLGISTCIWIFTMYTSKIMNFLSGICLIIFSLVLILLQSKTSFIAITITIIFMILIKIINQYKNRSGLKANKILSTLVKLLLFSSIGYFVLIKVLEKFNIDFGSLNRINDLFSGNLDNATTGRSDIWEGAFSHPNFILGTGFLSFRDEYARKAHSVYVSTFMETGLLGITLLILFYFFLIYVVKKMIDFNGKEIYTYLFITVFLMIFGFGNEIMEFKFFWQAMIIIHLIRYYFLEEIYLKNGEAINNEKTINNFTRSISSK